MGPTWEVLLPASIDPAGPALLDDVATFTSIDQYDDRTAFIEDCDRYDAMFVRVTEISSEVMQAATRLRVVAKHGAGLDNVDVDAATRNGVVVCNTPGANARSVAEHALLLLLSTRRTLVPADRHVRSGGWDRAAFTGNELSADMLGLLGFGDIARNLVDISQGLNLEYLTHDPYVPDEEFPSDVEQVPSVATVFERADAVSIHVPLTDETRGMVSAPELAALGPDGVLVNTARGEIVDEAALVTALEDGTIAGAGLDVFRSEPPAADAPLLDRDDVVVTPHVGGVTEEALERMSRAAADNVRTVYDGSIPEFTVNADGLDGVGRP